MAYFAIRANAGRDFTIYGDGKQVRDWLYIDDLVLAFELAVSKIDQIAGRIYNIDGGADRSLSVWTETRPILEGLARCNLMVTYADWRPDDQKVYVSDISRAKADFGWEPHVSPKDGIQRLWAWIQSNPELFV